MHIYIYIYIYINIHKCQRIWDKKQKIKCANAMTEEIWPQLDLCKLNFREMIPLSSLGEYVSEKISSLTLIWDLDNSK